MSNRIRWIDFGKGIAIMLVILGHVALGTLQSGRYSGNHVLVMHYLLELTYAVHIPVFFALSGYFFKPINSWRVWGNKIIKRLVSLGIPYVIFSIVMVILKEIGGSSVRHQQGLNGLINIYKTPINYLWFLYALFVVDAVLGVLSYFIKNKKLTMLILVLLFVADVMGNFSLPIIKYFCLWAPFFYLGYILKSVDIPRWLAWFSFIIYIIHVPVFCIFNATENFLFGYWRIVSVFGVIMMFYFFKYCCKKEHKFLSWVGLGSLEIYLIHAPVVSVIRILMFHIGITSFAIQLIMQFLFGFGVSLFVWWLANKIKPIEFIFRPTKYLHLQLF